MPFPLYIIDAFVFDKKPFTGNPAAVCVLQYDVRFLKKSISVSAFSSQNNFSDNAH